MAFVLDCSMAMAWVFADEGGEGADALRDSLLRETAVVPSLWPIEVGNVLLAATRRGRVQRQEWRDVEAALGALPIELDPVSLDSGSPMTFPTCTRSSPRTCWRGPRSRRAHPISPGTPTG